MTSDVPPLDEKEAYYQKQRDEFAEGWTRQQAQQTSTANDVKTFGDAFVQHIEGKLSTATGQERDYLLPYALRKAQEARATWE